MGALRPGHCLASPVRVGWELGQQEALLLGKPGSRAFAFTALMGWWSENQILVEFVDHLELRNASE